MLPFKYTPLPNPNPEGLVSDFVAVSDLLPYIVNISGGGLGLYSKVDITAGSLVECIITLTLPVYRTIRVYAKVLRSYLTPGQNFKLHMEFVIITEKVREAIIEFVFAYERHMLKNNQLVSLMSFVELPLNKLVEGKPIPFELYALIGSDIKFLADPGIIYDSIAKEFFKDKKVTKLYVQDTDDTALDEYLGRNKKVIKPFDREDIVSFNNYSFTKKQLHRIDNLAIKPKTDIVFKLICSHDYNYQTIVDASVAQPVTITQAIADIVKPMFVLKKDIPAYLEYLSITREVNILEHDLFIKEKTKSLLHMFYDDAKKTHLLSEIMAVCSPLQDVITSNPIGSLKLIKHSQDDFYPYCHMFNTAVLVAVLGLASRMPASEIEHLILAALLHDIGFSALNELIIDKNGRLSSKDTLIYQRHVSEGVSLLESFAVLPSNIITAIKHHHENCTATGYPMRLSAKEISLAGKCLAIVDTFDTLLITQPYKAGLSIENAIKAMLKIQTQFDPTMLKIFLAVILKNQKALGIV